MVISFARITQSPVRTVFRPKQLYGFHPRLLSSQQAPVGVPKEVSPHIGFYKTFGRPISKVLLMAIFTYQVAYWGWVKLEKDEIRSEREAEIVQLESKLQELMSASKSP